MLETNLRQELWTVMATVERSKHKRELQRQLIQKAQDALDLLDHLEDTVTQLRLMAATEFTETFAETLEFLD